jgi:predicted cobalt transporter CbtA
MAMNLLEELLWGVMGFFALMLVMRLTLQFAGVW